MRVAIAGAGNVGLFIANDLHATGHEVQLIEQNPRAATAFFTQLVLVFIKRLRDSSDLVAEVTRWGLEATGLNVDRPATGGH